MASKVALVELGPNLQQSFQQALTLIGGIDDLNTPERTAVIKVGIFDPKAKHHTTIDITQAIINSFNKASKIYLTESDNYRGTAAERLQIWKTLFTKQVTPISLTEDTNTKQTKIADETIPLSHILFKPNTFISTHVLRTYEQGSVLKNLLGLIPDKKKVRFHKKLETTLLDLYQAIGGIDLAVLDGTYINAGVASNTPKTKANILIVGRDAVAVEAVGYTLLNMNPQKIPVIREATKRGIGESNIERIQILGTPIETIKEKLAKLLRTPKKKTKASITKKKQQ